MLRTQIDPSIGEPRYPIGKSIALGRSEVESAEIERDDARLIIHHDAIEQPIGRGIWHAHTQHFQTCQRHTRRMSVVRQARWIENIESPRATEAQTAVAQS